MIKIKLLQDVITDVQSLAKNLQAVVDAMAEDENKDTQQAEPIKEAEVKKLSKAKVKEIKFEDVRATLAIKSQAGMTTQVRELINKYGATKLSEVDPKHYASILKDAEELKNE